MSRVGPDIMYALFTVFTITYGTQHLGLQRNQVLVAILIGSAFQLIGIPLAGAMSDRINRRLLYGVSAVCGLVWTVIFFMTVSNGSYLMVVVGITIGLVFHSFMYGPQAAFITEQFDIHLRSTGASLAYTIAGVVGGAMAPLIFTWLLSQYDSWVPLVCYVGVAIAVTIAGLILGRDPDDSEDQHLHRDRRLAHARNRICKVMSRCSSILACARATSPLVQRVDDGLVFGTHRTLPIRRREYRSETDPRQPGPQSGVRRGQQFAVRGVDERLVKTTIQSNERLGRRLVGRVHQGFLLGEDGAHCGDRRIAGGQHTRRRVPLEHATQIHQLSDLSAGQRGYPRPALRHHLHQSLGLQQQQRLAHRGARYPDLRREFLFVEERPGGRRQRKDLIHDEGVGLLSP